VSHLLDGPAANAAVKMAKSQGNNQMGCLLDSWGIALAGS